MWYWVGMAKKEIQRKNIKRWLLFGFFPVTSVIGIIFQDAISTAAKDKGVTEAVSSLIGFVMTSLWGVLAIAALFVLTGVVSTLYVEDWIASWLKKKCQKSAVLLVGADDELDVHMYERKGNARNVKHLHITNPACRTLFVEFVDELKNCTVKIFSENGEIRWSEWDSTDRYVFIHFESLPPNSWFLISFDDERNTSVRRQNLQEVQKSIPMKREIAMMMLPPDRVSFTRKEKLKTLLKGKNANT